MQKVSDIIAKPVYSLYEGLWLGTIIDVCINISNNKIKGLLVLSSDEEQQYFINSSDITSIGGNAIILKNVTKLAQLDCEINNLINKNALSILGEEWGKIVDIYFDDNYKILSVETNKNIVLPFEKIVNLGQDVVFFALDNKFKKWTCKPKQIFSVSKAQDIKVSILDEMSSTSLTGVELKTIGEVNNQTKSDYLLPKKIKQNPYFLLGRTASTSIKADNGDFIIKEGQKITEKAISKAQIHNLIYALSSCAN